MNDRTATDLLIGLRDRGNDRVWAEFCGRYRPVLIGFGRQMGLREADAEDAAQEALMAFAEAYREGKYQRERGRLRSWMYGIAIHKIQDFYRRRPREVAGPHVTDQTEFIERLPDDHTISEIWEGQWRKAVLQACLGEVRRDVQASTMRAFELCVLEGRTVDQTADELKMNREAVYKAKSRVLTRMRELREKLELDW
jgi:RNA polymerase sigma-70 factor (ECF subfamily)